MKAASKHSPRARLLQIGSAVFATLPFAFAVIRLSQARHDYRLLWIALASALGVGLVRLIAARRRRGVGSLAVFLVATTCAGVMGYVVGARAAAGVWGVAAVLGFCWGISNSLWLRSGGNS